MANLQDRYLLDVTQALAQLGQVDAAMARITTARSITLNTNSLTRATSQITALRAQLNSLGSQNTRLISLRLSTGNLGAVPNQLLNVERGVQRLTAAAGANLGMTQRLSGAFGLIPGPLGLIATGLSAATVGLNGLTTAQRLNTIGAYALVGGLAAIGFGVAALASHGVKQLGEFQSAVNTLNAQGPNLGANLDAQIRQLQANGGQVAQQFNRADLGIGVADLTKQGLENAEALKLVATSYKLAGAEGQKLTDSSTLLLANLRQFGKDGVEAADAAAYFGDVLAKGSLLAASGAKELQQGLAVVGPIADKANFSLEETVGILVALDNTGLKASTIGANAFRAVLLALASPTQLARKEIEQLGVATRNLDGTARPVRDVLMDLRKAAAVSGTTYDEATKAAIRQADSVESASTIFRSRGIVGFLNMTDSVEKYVGALNDAEGALDQYSLAMTQGPAKAQERLRKSVDDLALSFAQTFGSKLSSALDSAAQLFREIDTLAQNRDTFQAYVNVLVVGFGAITAAMVLNSAAARALLADSSFAGLMALYRASVAAQLFTKVAAGLRAVALAASLNFATGGAAGLLRFLALIPVGAAAALAGVALLAGGVAAYGLKIAADTRKTYDDIDRAANESQQKLMARVAELRQQGPLGTLKAKQLLLVELRFNQENTPEQNASLDKRLASVKAEIKAQMDADAARLAAAKGKEEDVAATEDQTRAYQSLTQALENLRDRFGEVGTTAFQKNLQDARKALDDFAKQVDDQLGKGELTPVQGDALKKQAQADRNVIVQGVIDKQMKADEELRLKHEREVQDAQLALVKDGRKKREVELQRELDDTRALYAEQIKTAEANARSAPNGQSRAAFSSTAVSLKRQEAAALKAIEEKGQQDLEQIAQEREQVNQERLQKAQAAQRGLLESQVKEGAAGLAELVRQRDAAVDLAGAAPQARLRAELRYAPLIAQVQQRQRELAGQSARAQLQADLDERLRAAKGMGQQQGALELAARETYLTDLRTLEVSEASQRNAELLTQEARVQKERLAIYKKALDQRLQNLDQATGAEIAALERTLTAERARAVANGDANRVEAIDGALVEVSSQSLSNLKDFQGTLRDVRSSTNGLRADLRELGQTPLEGAIRSAVSPIDALVGEARTQLADLRTAFGKVAAPTGAQVALFRAQEAQLTGIVAEATARRVKIKAEAEVQFGRDQLQRAVDLATTETEKLQALRAAASGDRGRLAELDAQITRLRAQSGSARELTNLTRQREDVQRSLTDRMAEEQAISQELLNSTQARAAAETQLAERLARTDADLAAVRAGNLRNLLGNLSQLDARINSSAGETQRNALVAERASLYGQILDLQEAMDRAPLDVEARRLSALKAERDQQLELAGLADDGVATGEASLEQARQDLALAERKLALARTSAQYDEAAAGRASAITAVSQAQRALSQARLADEDRRLSALQAQVKAEADLSGLSSDAVASKRLELAFTGQNLRETERRTAQAQELLLTEEQLTALQERRTQLLTQQAAQARELARLQVDALRAQVDFSEAATRSALTRSRAAGDQVALARVDLAATRERLRLNGQEQAAAAAQNLSDGERLDLQKARLDLLAQEAEGVRKLAAAERARVELQRALRDALDSLQTAAQGQGGDTGLTRTQAQLTRTQLKLREAEADADSLLLSLERTGGALGWEEAEQGRARVDALTGAISEYRASLNAVADAYDEQISGLDSVIDATSRLNDLSRTGDTSDRAAAAFTLQVAETRRQQALADTNRLLSDQSATYEQIAAAAGRVAQTEQDRAATLNATVQSLGEDFLKRVAQDPNANSNQLADALRQAGLDSTQRIDLINRLRRGERDALKDVQTVISDEAGRQLDQLRQRALKGLGEIEQLRAQSFQARADAARQFEEYARLSSAVRIADAGFNELEATQLAAVTRQEELQQLIAKTSAVNPNAIRRDEAQRTLKAENDALALQARLRLNLADITKVTRGDVADQRDINREIQKAVALASDPGLQAAQVKADTARQTAVLKALAPLQQQLDQERAAATAKFTQAALNAVTLPDFTAQAAQAGAGAGQAFVDSFLARLTAGLSRPVNVAVTGRLTGSGNDMNAARTINNTFNFITHVGGKSVPTSQEMIAIAERVFTQKVNSAVTASAWTGGCR